MTGGRILAVDEYLGYRPLLNVAGFFHRRQPEATVLYGQVLMFPNTQPITMFPQFTMFMQQFYRVPTGFTQMQRIPQENLEEYYYQMRSALGPREGIEPVKKAILTLNAAGYDPLKGFWLDFQGIIPLFDQDFWWENGDESDRVEIPFVQEPIVFETSSYDPMVSNRLSYAPMAQPSYASQPTPTPPVPPISSNSITPFVFTQTTPTPIWVIEHTLNGFPAVTIIDSTGELVMGNVHYDSPFQVTITFSMELSGFASLI